MSSALAYPWLFDLDYPASDGLPLAESDATRDYLIYSVEALRLYFQSDPLVYVSGNLFLYYEQGNPQAVVAPDVLVVFGVEKRPRRVYKTWEEEGRLPSFILEITSKSTASQDQGTKRGLYAYLGVQEYFQYDPTGDYLQPPLKGFELRGENYQPLEVQPLGDQDFQIWSQTLGLGLRLQSGQLRYWDQRQQRTLPNYTEIDQAQRETQHQLERERQRAERLAERLRQLGLDPADLEGSP